jgi:very-short-patch-repair endonuclease
VAKETAAQVLVLVPRTLADRPALDSILYGAEHVGPAGAMDAPSEVRTRPLREARHRVFPIIGRPHPFSPGEKLLATTLRNDPDLAPLFGFNLFVETVKGTRLLVDVLWAAGKVVVEVDSYQYHGGREAFATDRQRDYELGISGYTVLRLTHDEVLDHTSTAMAKIRDVVARHRARPKSITRW